MSGVYDFLTLSLLATIVISDNACTQSVAPKDKFCTYVVDHSFDEERLSAKDMERKSTLKEIHTYAELKSDPTSYLPGSFTVCSTIMGTIYHSFERTFFFNLLDNQLDQIIAANLRISITSEMFLLFPTGSTFYKKIPPTFTKSQDNY